MSRYFVKYLVVFCAAFVCFSFQVAPVKAAKVVAMSKCSRTGQDTDECGRSRGCGKCGRSRGCGDCGAAKKNTYGCKGCSRCSQTSDNQSELKQEKKSAAKKLVEGY